MNTKTAFFLAAAACMAAISCNNTAQRTGFCLPEGKALSIVSTSDRSLVFEADTLDFSDNAVSLNVVVMDSSVRYQTMDGFGAAVTGSTCYNLMQMAPADRNDFLQRTFSHDNGLGFSYIRISIGCSDFSLGEYTCCDTPGIENFSLQSEEKDYVIPVLKEILAINPDIRILGSPWTCPKWMKVNNLTDNQPFDSWTSGQLNPVLYDDYAEYFVKWIQAFEEEGISIYAVTPQNEPLNRGNSASLFMGWREQLDFVGQSLGPAFEKAGIDTKIYAFDHNYNYDNMSEQDDYPVHLYSDAEASSYIAGAAYHNYGGSREELNDIHSRYPDKELVFTETSIGTWNDGRNLDRRLMEDMREVGLGTVNNWCRGAIVWNLMLDSERGPNREGGCRTCYGAVDIDRYDYKTITYNSHYYVMGHLASVVKPGAVRIHSGSVPEGLMCSAFINPDGTAAFVVMNENADAVSASISPDGRKYLNVTLPARSVTSFRWK